MEFGIRVGAEEHEPDKGMRYMLDVQLWMGSQQLRWRLCVDTRPGKMLDINISRGPSSNVVPGPAGESDLADPATNRGDTPATPSRALRSAEPKPKPSQKQ
jgi:hypothetical protein